MHLPDVLAARTLGNVAPRFLGRPVRRRAAHRARRRRRTQPRASLAVRASIPAGGKRGVPLLPHLAFPQPVRLVRNPGRQLLHDAATRTPGTRPSGPPPRPSGSKRRRSPSSPRSLGSDLPDVVKEAALFNLSTLRTQTCFRTEDGRFFAWEGCGDKDGLLLGLVHPRLELRAGRRLPLRRRSPGRCARSSSRTRPTTDGLMSFRAKLPLGDGALGQGGGRRPDGLPHEDVPRLAALGRRRHAQGPLAERPQGPGILLDPRRLGRRQGRRHGGLPAQHDGRRVLTARIPRWDSGISGRSGPPRRWPAASGTTPSPRPAAALFENGSRWIDANLFNGRYYIHKVVPPMDKSANIAPSLLVGMGATDFANPDYQLGERLPRRPARRPVHGPRLRPRIPGRAGERPDDARKHPEVQPPRLRSRDHFNCMRTLRPRRRGGPAHGQLSRRPAGQSLPVFHRGHDRLRVHGRDRDALRGPESRTASTASPTSGPATTGSSATRTTRPSAAITTAGR